MGIVRSECTSKTNAPRRGTRPAGVDAHYGRKRDHVARADPVRTAPASHRRLASSSTLIHGTPAELPYISAWASSHDNLSHRIILSSTSTVYHTNGSWTSIPLRVRRGAAVDGCSRCQAVKRVQVRPSSMLLAYHRSRAVVPTIQPPH